MITTIIFDIGNVLVDFCWEEYLHSFGFEKEIEKRIAQATVLNGAWNEFDRGSKTEAELIDDFVKNDPEIETEIRCICEDIHDMIRIRDYAIPWVKELKAMGYQVYYLSNFSAKAERECAHALGFLEYMDGGILSYKEKMIKPDSGIYKTLIERYDLIPEECIFLDDLEANCKAANAQGIRTIQFTTKESAVEELKKLGVY